MTAALPASAIAGDGSGKLTATNPTPGGGTSAALDYAITVPTPVVTAISPQNVTQGAAAVVTITGTGFEANSVAQWNGSGRVTTYVNSTTLQLALTASDTASFGIGQVSVANPGLAPTTPFDLVVLANNPTITYVSPSSVVAESQFPQSIFISGSGFAANATVQANGQPVAVSNQSATSISFSLPATYFASAGTISIVVSNPGSPVVSSNPATITVTSPTAAAFSISPNYAAAGSPDTTITVSGSSFYADSVVSWNNTPLASTYVNANTLTAVVPASLITGFVQASISVNTPEDSQQPAPQPFDTFLELPVNDIIYSPTDGYIYASIPGYAGSNLGNTVAAIDPVTGVIQKTIFAGSQPNRLAISSDGTQLFVGLDGAGAVAQINLTTATLTGQFTLGAGSQIGSSAYTATSLATLPGSANSVAVFTSNGDINIFDSGVARAKDSSRLQVYLGSGSAITFGSSSSILYCLSNGTLYQFTVDSTGVSADTALGSANGGTTLQYDNGRLYTPQGLVYDATTGDQDGQFSIIESNGTSPTPAAGPIASDSSLNLAWIIPSSYGSSNQLISFNETTFDPAQNIALTGVGALPTYNGYYASSPADLIRWGTDGLAFHTQNQIYVINGSIVKDQSTSPADISVSVQAPANATTGSAANYTIQVANAGPDTAQGVTLTNILPSSIILGSVTTSQGSCSGTSIIYCDLGSITTGSSVTVTISITPTTAGSLTLTSIGSTISYDPVSTNNQSSASVTATGSAFYAPPVVTQLSPVAVQAGSTSFTLTVDGEGFGSGSTVMWNGTQLPTTFLNSGQLTATVDSSLIQQLGWSSVSVSTPAPGGGQSSGLPLSIYQIVNLPANAMTYDPFTRKLYAVLPSTATTISGNSIVTVDPTTGNIGSPVQVGSEPNLVSETSDGNYIYVGLSGANSLGRFNLSTQAVDLTVPLPANSSYTSTTTAATAIATVPGSDTSLAVEEGTFDTIGILDITGSTGTFRRNSTGVYDGDFPVFSDATHFYAYSSIYSQLFRYSISSSGVSEIDTTALNGLGGVTDKVALDSGYLFGAGGGIVNPSTTPPSQVAVLQLGSGVTGSSAVPYAAESKTFNMVLNQQGSSDLFLDRFDTQQFTLDQQIPLGTISYGASVQGTRWGQDGLAYILPAQSSTQPAQIFLLRGPFVLPAEEITNTAPTLSSTNPSTITAGSGNVYVTVTGTGFIPGATVLWNSAARTTTYVSSTQVTVDIPASDVATATTGTLSCQNPGSAASNTVSITVQ